MGYAVVVWEASVSSRAFGRSRHDAMLKSMSGAMIVVLGIFLVLRLIDLVVRGDLMLAFNQGALSVMFWIENILMAAAIFYLAGRRRERFSNVMKAALLIMFAGALYRFDAYILAYNPGPGWSYFPSLLELFITFGVVAAEIALYIVIVKRFPILAGKAPAESRT
jgi:Ni/Fe-hydrogenase subunit HybB-like protein